MSGGQRSSKSNELYLIGLVSCGSTKLTVTEMPFIAVRKSNCAELPQFSSMQELLDKGGVTRPGILVVVDAAKLRNVEARLGQISTYNSEELFSLDAELGAITYTTYTDFKSVLPLSAALYLKHLNKGNNPFCRQFREIFARKPA